MSEEQEKKKKKKGLGAVRWVIIAVCLCVFSFSGWKLYGILSEYKENKDTYDQIAEAVLIDPVVPDTQTGTQTGTDDPQTNTENNTGEDGQNNAEEKDPIGISGNISTQKVIPEVDFAALKKISKNAVAWLYSPDTVINYPVAQAKDNDYYLNHALNGSYNSGGTLFMDYRNASDFSDRNTIIYGHHLRSGNMFASLEKYRKQSYYDKHPTLYLTTAQGKYKLEVVAGYVTPSISDAYELDFDDNSAFWDWLNKAIEKSNFKTKVKLVPSDKIVTLSTCVYDYENARYVLHCKLVKCENGTWY